MATGKEGSSLTAELNRLNSTTGVAAQGAANTYAGTSGLGINAALNIKASGISTRQPSAYKGLNAVCDELASTTDKSAVAALRSINI